MSFLRGVKKGAGLGLGAALANRVLSQAAPPMQQQAPPMQPMQQQPMQPQQPRQPGFFDRLAGSAENMMNATAAHINSASVGTCDYCGTGLGTGDRTCSSCCAPVG